MKEKNVRRKEKTVRYKYPKISNALTYRRIDSNTVEIIDHINDQSFNFGIDAARYAKKLDGKTNPYVISTNLSFREIEFVLNDLEKYGLTRHSDTRRLSFGTRLKTLWIPKQSTFLRVVAYISNVILLSLWLPMLILGVVMFYNNIEQVGFDWLWAGFFIGLLCGALFHELGHAFAGIVYGARVFEMGVLLMYCILPGAYVLLDRSPVKNRLQRIQINAAGVEANFLLCGVFLLAGALIPSLGGMFMSAAACNAIIGAINLAFIKGLDGAAIVSDLIGIEDVIDRAKYIVTKRGARKRILRQGAGGYAAVTMCYMLVVLQIALPVLLVANILEVVACFV